MSVSEDRGGIIPGKAGGNKRKRVHINSCKPYNQVQVCRVAFQAREDEIVDGMDKKLEGDVLTYYRQKEMDRNGMIYCLICLTLCQCHSNAHHNSCYTQ